MAFVSTGDGVRLHVEDVGSGAPIVFVHEFAGDQRSWEPQLRFFSRRYRCITYNARGYPPSDVPPDSNSYSQALAAADIGWVMDRLGLGCAHIVGLSMGGFAALHFALDHPDRTMSIVLAACGYGAEKIHEAHFKILSETTAKNFLTRGSKAVAETYALSASRVQFQNKDPRGWREFADRLGEHPQTGAAYTMLGVQARRPSLYDLEDRLRKMTVPTLLISGDEDDHCLRPALFMKQVIPASGLLVLPKTGHTLNLEEPYAFNNAVADFLAMVESGKWLPRDPRANPDEIIRSG